MCYLPWQGLREIIMIKIKTNTALTNFKGEELKNGEHVLDVGTAVSMVLGGKVSNPTLGYTLGKKFANEKEVELKAEDVVFIKKELEAQELWNALVVGQLIELLDGKKE